MTREQKQIDNQVSKKCKASLVFSLGLVVSLGIVKMILSNRASTWGHNLQSIKLEAKEIRKQNIQLKSQITKKTGGLERLADQAKEKGFTDKPNYKYFTSGPDVAQVIP